MTFTLRSCPSFQRRTKVNSVIAVHTFHWRDMIPVENTDVEVEYYLPTTVSAPHVVKGKLRKLLTAREGDLSNPYSTHKCFKTSDNVPIRVCCTIYTNFANTTRVNFHTVNSVQSRTDAHRRSVVRVPEQTASNIHSGAPAWNELFVRWKIHAKNLPKK